MVFSAILKPKACFGRFPRFHPTRPEPPQNPWFYQDSCHFKRFSSHRLVLVGSLPEPLQNAWFYKDSYHFKRFCAFCAYLRVFACICTYVCAYLLHEFMKICMYLHWFRRICTYLHVFAHFQGLTLSAQNPYRTHDSTRIHAILSDFQAKGLFW